MRVLWHSNAPWCHTGYASQTALFAPRLRDLGHEVAISAYWGLAGAVMGWQRIPVYPGDEVFGNRLLRDLAAHHRADLVITLMDVWVLDPARVSGLPLACWVPVDHDPCPPKVIEFFTKTGAKPIAMSRFGERMLADAGLDPLYVPHAVDTTVYKPQGDRSAEVARLGVPEDAFLLGMVAANKGNNPPRKAFPQVLQAFAQIQHEIPNAYLYLHADPVGQRGVHLAQLADQLGISPDRLRGPGAIQLEFGMSAQEMASLYSAFDVLLNPSYGEGFGVPIVEAQACGTPVIVTDCTAMTEVCGAGWKIPCEPWFDPAQRSFYGYPSVAGIADAIRDAASDRSRLEELGRQARGFALQYDVGRVTHKYWAPALKTLAGNLDLDLAVAA